MACTCPSGCTTIPSMPENKRCACGYFGSAGGGYSPCNKSGSPPVTHSPVSPNQLQDIGRPGFTSVSGQLIQGAAGIGGTISNTVGGIGNAIGGGLNYVSSNFFGNDMDLTGRPPKNDPPHQTNDIISPDQVKSDDIFSNPLIIIGAAGVGILILLLLIT